MPEVVIICVTNRYEHRSMSLRIRITVIVTERYWLTVEAIAC